jgi:hypothetical protein
MNDAVTTLVKTVLQKESLQDCSLEELQNLARQYPYFTAGQFLLAQKLKLIDDHLYHEQLQRLSLHFNNPLWLDYLLNDHKTEMQVEENNQATEEITEVASGKYQEEKLPEETMPEEAQQIQTGTGIYNTETEEKTTGTELSFEPYHTVDYFASQGIKFSQEEKPVDRFGQQLKSFTEWIKTMKRLPPTEIEKNIDTTSEDKVLQLADRSITEGDVITEAMAEVWEKQGNKEKAIAVYDKLSLLNPSKSHYFAAKIEQLKNS